jgi:hypothetical protein
MSTYDFMVAAKKAVCNWIANRYAVESRTVAIDWTDVFIVWQCKTLQNHKAILAAPTPDQYLFEATYNGDKEQMHLDVYDKIGNVCINGVNMEV